MNDLSNDALIKSHWSCTCNPIPTPVLCILPLLFFIGLTVSIFIFVAVHNAIFLISLLIFFALLLSFLLWNSWNWTKQGPILLFLADFPDSDLNTADNGQLVKITGLASCGSLSLESSYEKVPRCVYTSTLLYEYRGFGSNSTIVNGQCFQWSLAHSERFITDFYITDTKSGIRAMVKAGYNSKVTPLIGETTIVNTRSRNRVLSSYLRTWLGERNLSAESRILRLEEGYIKEGSSVTVMGVLNRNNGVAVIGQPPEPISTGCLWRRLLLPADIDGLVLGFSGSIDSATPCSSHDPGH
ncbi:putative membrane protein At1g16860 [Tasmannia lanceolata]|uniref:putative membrane protein At1g16860 n=1 Tax=Tasmannia lanceolata TaxID=3420 RepID=UPI004063079F